MSSRGAALLVAVLFALPGIVRAEDGEGIGIIEKGKEFKKWSNATSLSIVITEGNSDTETVSFGDTLVRRWRASRFRLRLETTISNTADDRYAIVDCMGQDPTTCAANLPADPDDAVFTVVEPPVEPDVGKYFIEPRYDQAFSKKMFWNVGASWYRDIDAGIRNRYMGFAGLGHIVWDRDDLSFNLTYGVSYTDREEEEPDPEKDGEFPGFRFNWDYMVKWGKSTTYTNDWTFNFNISDTQDYSTSMTNAISVSINKWLALEVSLQWIYNNIPALEDIDLFLDAGQIVHVGDVDVRREPLDTIFKTSLVINF